jgi:hypothetical protein
MYVNWPQIESEVTPLRPPLKLHHMYDRILKEKENPLHYCQDWSINKDKIDVKYYLKYRAAGCKLLNPFKKSEHKRMVYAK